jgi:hypothetical protein
MTVDGMSLGQAANKWRIPASRPRRPDGTTRATGSARVQRSARVTGSQVNRRSTARPVRRALQVDLRRATGSTPRQAPSRRSVVVPGNRSTQ